MNKIILRSGDFFCVKGSNMLSKLIVAVEEWQSKDGDAKYSHSEFITDETGNSIGARTTIRAGNINDFAGCEVLIGRWEGMTIPAFQNGIEAIKWNLGEIYPFGRLFLFLVRLAKINTWNVPTCFELVSKFLMGAGCVEIGQWEGQTPDDGEVMIKKWRSFSTVYEGVWTKQ